MKKILKVSIMLIVLIISFSLVIVVNAADETISSTQTNSTKKDTITVIHNYGEPLPGEGNAVLKDGYLYYSKSKNEEPKKVEGVANIKSLYIYNIGTGINKVPFVVTNDGIVYRLNSEEKLVKYEELANYKVDKIISHEGEIYDVFTLLLLDGTTKVVIVENDESVDFITKNKNYGEPLPYEGRAELKDGYLYYSKSQNEELKKVEGISNIKLLNIYNIGTGINKVPFVVTNDGSVYRLNFEEKLVKYEELSNYKVDKILKHDGEMYDVFTLLLLDGSTKVVIVKLDNAIDIITKDKINIKTDGSVDLITTDKTYGEPLPYEGKAVLKDGYLYYSRSENEELKKVEGVSNIKSLYIFNLGTGINRVPFVVTNDGIVYRLNDEEKLVRYDGLSNYKVSEIISHESDEAWDSFKLLLLDGTQKNVEVKFIPTISDEEKKEDTETKITTDENEKTNTDSEKKENTETTVTTDENSETITNGAKKDDTVSPVKIPKTGRNFAVIIISGLIITLVAIIMYKKHKM